jgi:ribosome-binding protein aMBF1 (putative translation factor)
VKAKAKPALLRWARESRGFDRHTAAERPGIDVSLLEAVERGEAQLTFA